MLRCQAATIACTSLPWDSFALMCAVGVGGTLVMIRMVHDRQAMFDGRLVRAFEEPRTFWFKVASFGVGVGIWWALLIWILVDRCVLR